MGSKTGTFAAVERQQADQVLASGFAPLMVNEFVFGSFETVVSTVSVVEDAISQRTKYVASLLTYRSSFVKSSRMYTASDLNFTIEERWSMLKLDLELPVINEYKRSAIARKRLADVRRYRRACMRAYKARLVQYQSGSVEEDRIDKRERREMVQRAIAAQKKAKEVSNVWKAKTKLDRKNEIRLRREQKWFSDVPSERIEYQMFSAISRVAQGARKLERVIDSLDAAVGDQRITEIVDDVASSAGNVRNITDYTSQVIDWLKSAVDSIKKHFHQWFIIPVTGLFAWLISKYTGLVSFFRSAIVSYLEKIVPKSVVAYIFEPKVEHQSFVSMDFISTAIKVAVKVLISPLGLVLPRNWMTWLERETIGQRDANLDSVLMYCMRAINTLSYRIQSWMGCKECFDIFTDKTRVVAKWIAASDKAVDALEQDKTVENWFALDSLRTAGLDLRLEWIDAPQTASMIERQVGKIRATLNQLSGLVKASENIRKEPVFVMIQGIPGIGKTAMTQWFVSECLVRSGIVNKPVDDSDFAFQDFVRNVETNIWSKGTSEFFEGYAGQKVFIIDDFGQTKVQKTDKETIYSQIIAAMNIFAYPLNMATLEQKGKVYFGSELLFGSTNLSSMKAQVDTVLNESGAFFRRITFGYKLVLVNRDVMMPGSKKLNPICLDRYMANNDGAFPYDWYSAVPHNFDTGVACGDPISLSDLVELVVEKLEMNHKIHQSKQGHYHKFLRKIAYQAGSVEFAPGAPFEEQEPDFWRNPFEVEMNDLNQMFSHESPRAGPPDPILERCYRYEADAYAPPDVTIDQNVIPESGYINSRARQLWAEHDKLRTQGTKEDLEDFINSTGVRIEDLTTVLPDWWGPLFGKLCPFWMKPSQVEGGKGCSWHPALDDLEIPLHGQDKIEVTEKATIDLMAWQISLAFVSVAMFVMWFSCVLWQWLKPLMTFVVEVIIPTISNACMRIWNWLRGLFRPERHVRHEMRIVGDEVSSDGAVDKIMRNVVRLAVRKPGEENKLDAIGSILAISGSVFAVPTHYLGQLKQLVTQGYSNISMYYVGNKRDAFCKFSECTIEEFLNFDVWNPADKEVCFMNIPRSMIPARGDIRHFFCDRDHNVMINSGRIMDLHKAKIVSTAGGFSFRYHTLSAVGTYRPKMEWTMVDNKKVQQTAIVEAPISTIAGDCGSPLMFSSGTIKDGKYLVGIHVAGTFRDTIVEYGKHQAYTAVITRDMVDLAFVKLTESVVFEAEGLIVRTMGNVGDNINTSFQCPLPENSMVSVGLMETPLRVNTNTSINKEDPPWRDMFGPCPKKPAWLRNFVNDGVLIEPWRNAVSKYDTIVPIVEGDWIEPCMSVAVSQFSRLTVSKPRFVLSFEQAVLGIPARSFGGLNRGSSPGYPLCRMRDADNKIVSNKRWLFATDTTIDYTNELTDWLVNEVDDIVSAATRGERLAHFYTDFLKDELRPNDKVKAGKTRLVSGCPLPYCIAVRMYFGAFIASFYESRILSGMAPGVKNIKEWGDMVKFLEEVSEGKEPVGFDGDFSAFDASELPVVLWRIFDYIDDWYKSVDHDEKGSRVRRVLFYDLVESLHISSDGCLNGQVVQWCKSLPSGHPLTTIVNSFYSLFCLVVGFDFATDGTKTGKFWNLCRPQTYGDDNLIVLHESVQGIFNQDVMAMAMEKRLYLTYTDASKSAELLANKKLSDMTFLKRGFRKVKFRGNVLVLCPLDIQSIIFRNYHFKSEAQRRVDRCEKAEMMLQELSMHEKDVWDKYARRIYEVLAEENFSVNGFKYPKVSFSQSFYLLEVFESSRFIEPWDNCDVADTGL